MNRTFDGLYPLLKRGFLFILPKVTIWVIAFGKIKRERKGIQMSDNRRKVNGEQLVKLLNYGFTRRQCADFFNCTEMVINTFVRKEYGMTFEQLKAEHSAQLKANIMSNLINLSETNATVAIFLAKSVCGLNENFSAPANDDSEKAFAGALRKASKRISDAKDMVSIPDDDGSGEDIL